MHLSILAPVYQVRLAHLDGYLCTRCIRRTKHSLSLSQAAWL
jgi:hypothetical protein